MKNIETLLKEKNVRALAYALFGVMLKPSQEEIVRNIAFKENKKTVISAYTRYGKSYSVALGICMYILFYENKRINLIAPTGDQSQILRNYITGFILECNELSSIIDIELSRDVDKLKKEVSKKRITFKNGCELRVFSASGTGERLMGWGGDLIVLDESCLVNPEVYRTKISRMLGDNPDTMIVEIGNPFTRDYHMYEHWIDPSWHQIHIDWKKGLEEERIVKAFLEEQRSLLTPNEFKVLYDAEFPEDSEDTLIRYNWIETAMKKDSIGDGVLIAGLDVAELGNDLTVLTICRVKDNNYEILSIDQWKKQDTMTTVNKVINKIDKNMLINVDSTGVGRGVYDRLNELGYNAREIKVGRTAISDKDRFQNQKADFFWAMREAFEQERIKIIKEPELISQLNNMKYDITTAGKIKIIDPDTKSPDYADSLMLCFAKEDKFKHLHYVVDLQ